MGASDRQSQSDLENQWFFDVGAEQSVIGAILLDNAAFDLVADVVRADDFYTADHRDIFSAAAGLCEKGRTADAVTVSAALAGNEGFGRAGGMGYLMSLVQATPSTRTARRYAEIVRDRSVLRALHKVTTRIQDSLHGYGGGSVRELLDAAQAQMLEVSEARRSGQEYRELNAVLGEVFEFVDAQFHRVEAGLGGEVTGMPTGFSDLDRETTGFHGGQLIVLAARPSMGKSALSLNIAENAARSVGKAALVFSLEMRARELGLRLLASASSVNVKRLITGRINDEEWQRITHGAGRLQDVPIFISESGSLTVSELRAVARRAQRSAGGLSCVVVDYLQLMSGRSRDGNRVAELSEISRGLKTLAGELDVPVIALSQLNREVEKRPNKRPMLSDLRESGSIEQDADIVLFIYRDEVYHPDTEDRGVAEIIIAKQRNGPVGKVRLTFLANQTRFCDYVQPVGRV